MPISSSTLVGCWQNKFLKTSDLLDICMFLFIKIMILISDFLQNSKLTAISLSSRVFIFIVLQEL